MSETEKDAALASMAMEIQGLKGRIEILGRYGDPVFLVTLKDQALAAVEKARKERDTALGQLDHERRNAAKLEASNRSLTLRLSELEARAVNA